MYKDSLFDELRRVDCEVAEGERELAEQEARVAELKRGGQDASTAQALLEAMREKQRFRDQERQRLLALVHP